MGGTAFDWTPPPIQRERVVKIFKHLTQILGSDLEELSSETA